MKHKWSLAAGVCSWSGRTRAAAAAAKQAHLERLFAEFSRVPIPIMHDGRVEAICWQEHSGWWAYALVHSEDGRLGCVTSSNWSRRDAEFRARRHVAQNVFEMGVTAPRVNGLDVIHPEDDEGQRAHLRWVSWQVAYAQAVSAGSPSDEARAVANATETSS